MEAFKIDEEIDASPSIEVEVAKRKTNSELFSSLLGLYNFFDIGKLVVSSNNIVFTPVVEVFESFLNLKKTKNESKVDGEKEGEGEASKSHLKLVSNNANNKTTSYQLKKYLRESSRKLSGKGDAEDTDSGVIINKKHY